MDIKGMPTLAEKQAFWVEQRPYFEEKYWLKDHFDFVEFDLDQGNYVVKQDLEPIYEDDAYEIFHRVNTGWAMWKRAITFCRGAQKVAVPEGFVLMPIKPTETMVMAVVDEHEGDAFLPYSIYDAYVKQAMIEAQERSHD